MTKTTRPYAKAASATAVRRKLAGLGKSKSKGRTFTNYKFRFAANEAWIRLDWDPRQIERTSEQYVARYALAEANQTSVAYIQVRPASKSRYVLIVTSYAPPREFQTVFVRAFRDHTSLPLENENLGFW